MKNITFLFGAGASAGTKKQQGLPIVNELPDRITGLIQEIRNKNLLSDIRLGKGLSGGTMKSYSMNLIKDLEWVSNEARNHASVDTFAKKLFLKGENERENLRRLKIALSLFFILEQSRRPLDIRYDAFFASILNETPSKFPEHIRILSWNYDYQFEKAYSGYSDSSDLLVNQTAIRVFSKFDGGSLQPNHFVTIKLNGTTGFSDGSTHYYDLRDLSSNFDIKLMREVVKVYADLQSDSKKNLYPLLSFAWESEGFEGETIVEKAITCTQDTHVLVVIGYSFPFFNREVDRAIISKMQNLEKVYFQAPDAENIRTRFQAVRSNMQQKDLVAYTDVGSFLLPDEL